MDKPTKREWSRYELDLAAYYLRFHYGSHEPGLNSHIDQAVVHAADFIEHYLSETGEDLK